MKIKRLLVIVITFSVTSTLAYAFVNCQSKYANHPLALPNRKNDCSICHISPNGAGPQNAFGKAFQQAGFKITDDLIAKFPELFLQEAPKTEETDTKEEESVTEAGSAPAPKIKRIKPIKVTINNPITVKVIGNNFVQGSKIFLNDEEISTTFLSDMILQFELTLTNSGKHTIKVINPDNKESNVKNIKGKGVKQKGKK